MKKYEFYVSISVLTLAIIFLATMANAATYTISGKVFDDKNCNGQRNAGDNGISGVTITLTPGALVDVTDANGDYSFSGLAAGTYVVKETDPAGYCSTTPNKKTVKVKNRNVININFGDSKLVVSPPGSSCCP